MAVFISRRRRFDRRADRRVSDFAANLYPVRFRSAGLALCFNSRRAAGQYLQYQADRAGRRRARYGQSHFRDSLPGGADSFSGRSRKNFIDDIYFGARRSRRYRRAERANRGGIYFGFGRLAEVFRKRTQKLVVCGVSAALSAVLGAPIGGAIFGVEVLFVGDFFYPVLLPAVISSISSYFVCVALSVSYAVPAVAIPPLSLAVFSWCIMAAVFFSFVCIYHVETVHFICSRFQKVKIPLPVKSFIASGILLCTAAVWGDLFLGMGEEGLMRILSGQSQPWYAFLLKSVLLAVTLSGGGSGGVLTPTFYIGAAAGSLFAAVFGLDTGFSARWGLSPVSPVLSIRLWPQRSWLLKCSAMKLPLMPGRSALSVIC